MPFLTGSNVTVPLSSPFAIGQGGNRNRDRQAFGSGRMVDLYVNVGLGETKADAIAVADDLDGGCGSGQERFRQGAPKHRQAVMNHVLRQ